MTVVTMLCTCERCGWVYMGVTREYAQDEVQRFNDYFATLSEEIREMFGDKPSDIANYEGCRICRNNKFRPFKEGDCPDGCTIGPVIYEQESSDGTSND